MILIPDIERPEFCPNPECPYYQPERAADSPRFYRHGVYRVHAGGRHRVSVGVALVNDRAADRVLTDRSGKTLDPRGIARPGGRRFPKLSKNGCTRMISPVISKMLSHCVIVGTVTPRGAAISVLLSMLPHLLASSPGIVH